MSQSKKQKRAPRYSAARKAAVVARKVKGQSERGIARDLGMSRNTVAKIRNDGEFREVVASYRREATKLIAPTMAVLEKTLAQAEPEEVEEQKFGKIEVRDGKELARLLQRTQRNAWKAGFKAGSDGLKAAIASMNGMNVFTSRQQVEVESGADSFEGMSAEELEARIDELEVRNFRLSTPEKRQAFIAKWEARTKEFKLEVVNERATRKLGGPQSSCRVAG